MDPENLPGLGRPAIVAGTLQPYDITIRTGDGERFRSTGEGSEPVVARNGPFVAYVANLKVGCTRTPIQLRSSQGPFRPQTQTLS